MVSFKEAAIKVLEKSEKPMKVAEIMEHIIKKRYISSFGATPESTLSGVLNKNIKGSNPRFIKTGTGCFSLNLGFEKEQIKKEIEMITTLMGKEIRYTVKI